jgi:nitrogen fixation-related uncharacterized protein
MEQSAVVILVPIAVGAALVIAWFILVVGDNGDNNAP